MRSKKVPTDSKLTDQISAILSTRPAMAERILSILQIAEEPLENGKIRSADEVELMLIEELRKLGNESLSGWAGSVGKSASSDLKVRSPKAKLREKKL